MGGIVTLRSNKNAIDIEKGLSRIKQYFIFSVEIQTILTLIFKANELHKSILFVLILTFRTKSCVNRTAPVLIRYICQ